MELQNNSVFFSDTRKDGHIDISSLFELICGSAYNLQFLINCKAKNISLDK